MQEAGRLAFILTRPAPEPDDDDDLALETAESSTEQPWWVKYEETDRRLDSSQFRVAAPKVGLGREETPVLPSVG